MLQSVSVVCFYFILSPVWSDHVPAVVTIKAGGFMAEVAISGTEGSGNVSFQFKSFHSSSGLQLSDITIAIYELPPPYYRLCTGTDVGDIYDPTDARTSASYESACMNNRTSCAVGDLRNRLGIIGDNATKATTFPGGNWYLSGRDSMIGRSLVIYNGTRGTPLACGRIRRQTDGDLQEISLIAKLYSPVGGVVSFRQVVNTSTGTGFDTEILVNIFSNNGSATAGGFMWYLASGWMSESYDCSSFSLSPTTQPSCGRDSMDRCLLADLTGKHGALTVRKGEGQRSFFTDTNLNLRNISNMVLVVGAPMGYLSCGNVEHRLGVKAEFTGDINGYISCTPGEGGGLVQVNLDGLNGQASDYDIHLYPVNGNDCSGAGGHFDPFGNQEHDGMDSHDDRMIGSLSGKMSVNVQKFDPTLRCDGWYGILGRSVGIHWKNGSLWQCANLAPLTPANVSATKSSVVAQFTDDYSGYIRLAQWKLSTGQLSATVVDAYVRKTGSMTSGHTWHVHVTRPASFTGNGAANCAGGYAGGHYNPHNVYLKGDYSEDCNSQNQLRCELGDLSGKHGRYTIETSAGTVGRQLSQDIDLPLFGPTSVKLRSIVIHAPNAGAPRLICATLYPDGHRPYRVTFKKPDVVNNTNIQAAIANGLNINAEQVMFLNVNSAGQCSSASFAVPDAATSRLSNDFESSLSTADKTFGGYKVDRDCLSASAVDCLHQGTFLLSLVVLMLLFLL